MLKIFGQEESPKEAEGVSVNPNSAGDGNITFD